MIPAMADATNERLPVNHWFTQPDDQRLAYVVDLMRDLSRQTDPGEAATLYGKRVGPIFNADARLSLSRRDLQSPAVRITNSPLFKRPSDPWNQRGTLPVVEGGLLAELIYRGEPRVINDLVIPADDPAAAHLVGVRSLVAIPLYDGGEAVHMVVICRHDVGAFADESHFPEHVWLSNLFGRATANLVTRRELEKAYGRLEKELQTVAEIQRSLLPEELPKMPGIDVAAYYRTSALAGGDYYDFFDLPDGKLGLLIADVSGHGTPAAVMMAVTHAVAHAHHGPPAPPGQLLSYVNQKLCKNYTKATGTFVTAFYGIFDPATRELCFSSAGHNPPRIKRAKGGPNGIVEADPALPLGIDADEPYHDASQRLEPGDTLVLYTDGITEARDPSGELFGTERLDAALNVCHASAQDLVDCTVNSVDAFTGGGVPTDDRTLLVLQV